MANIDVTSSGVVLGDDLGKIRLCEETGKRAFQFLRALGEALERGWAPRPPAPREYGFLSRVFSIPKWREIIEEQKIDLTVVPDGWYLNYRYDDRGRVFLTLEKWQDKRLYFQESLLQLKDLDRLEETSDRLERGFSGGPSEGTNRDLPYDVIFAIEDDGDLAGIKLWNRKYGQKISEARKRLVGYTPLSHLC